MLLYLFLAFQSVFGHSWLDCTSVSNIRYTNVNDIVANACDGFPRGYVGRSNPDANMIKVMSDDPDTPACPGRSPNSYKDQFPVTHAKAGETLTMMWLPNGHTMWHRPPPPAGPRNVYIKWTGVKDQDLVTVSDVQEAKDLIPPVQFDQPCHNRFNGENLDSSAGTCMLDYSIPKGTPNGRYQLVWYWPFRFSPAVVEDYYSCWDVIVEGGSDGGNQPQNNQNNGCSTNCPPHLSCCGSHCYSTNQYRCDNGNLVPQNNGGACTANCPPHLSCCGPACYSTNEYRCDNGNLSHL